MARSSAAARRPPAPEPSAPAGGFARRAPQSPPADKPSRPAAVDLNAPADVEVAVESAHRSGRGAQSNAAGRFEPVARTSFDDGWQTFEDVPRTIAIGTNTDPYQPIEREHQIMRRILEVLDRYGHPVGIVTKSALVLRDIDILARMAQRNLVKVALSVTTLDGKLARVMEPRAATPPRRLEALQQLAAAGVPASVMVAPVIPALNDPEIERILEAAAAVGVREAGYVLIRLPLEVRDLFREWLMANFPDRYRHVFKLIRETRGGKDYDSSWNTRMTGAGPVAWMIGRRFELACEKLGFNKMRTRLAADHFCPPRRPAEQLTLL